MQSEVQEKVTQEVLGGRGRGREESSTEATREGTVGGAKQGDRVEWEYQ